MLSPDYEWKSKIMAEFHSTPAGGHQGVLKCYQRLKKKFYWQGMKKDVKQFISNCHICQQ